MTGGQESKDPLRTTEFKVFAGIGIILLFIVLVTIIIWYCRKVLKTSFNDWKNSSLGSSMKDYFKRSGIFSVDDKDKL